MRLQQTSEAVPAKIRISQAVNSTGRNFVRQRQPLTTKKTQNKHRMRNNVWLTPKRTHCWFYNRTLCSVRLCVFLIVCNIVSLFLPRVFYMTCG